MKIALFGGSFDPVHREHVRLAEAAVKALGLDKIVILPSFVAPHKSHGAFASGEVRLQMCRIAFSKLKEAEVSDFELNAGGTSYTYLTCRAFRERYKEAEIYFLVGADMLEDFVTWREPDDILSHVTLAVCGRGEALDPALHQAFLARFHKDFAEIPFTGEEVSSTAVRVSLAFGKRPKELFEEVLDYLEGISSPYSYPEILPALSLEKEERREHSFRVALMAAARARSLRVPEKKAVLAAALHDCAKYVPPESPLLCGFDLPEEVPSPVVHQFTGAYLAEHMFGVKDEEVLLAIRYHASGRANMSPLEALIYLSDLLEPSRTFEGVEELRRLFWSDLEECLRESLKRQMQYLEKSGKPIYRLTEEAFLWETKGKFLKN